MLAKKYRLSHWEASLILINSIVCKMFTSFPRVFTINSGTGQWVTSVVVCVVAFLLWLLICKLMKRFGTNDILQIANSAFGKLGKRTVAIVICLYLFLSAAIILGDFSAFMKSLFLTNTPLIFVTMFLAAGMIAAPLIGFHSIIRINFIWVPCIILVTFFSVLPGLFEADKNYLFPMLGTGFKSVFLRGFFLISVFTDIVLLLVMNPFLNAHVNIKKIGLSVIGISGTLVILVPLGLIKFMQWPNCNDIQFPIYHISQDVHFGKIFQRLDSFFIITWSMSILLYLSTALFFVTYIIKKAFSLVNNRPLAWIFGLLITIFSLCISDRQIRFYLLENSLRITWILPFVIPCLLCAAATPERKSGQ